MAKANKQNKSIDELLQDAIIWDEKTPYEIPDNWVWTKLGNLCNWASGGTPSRAILSYYTGDNCWVKTGELNDSFVYSTEEKISDNAILHSSAKLFPMGTVLMAMYGATIGKLGILAIDSTTNQACAAALPNDFVNNKYLFYYLMRERENFIKLGQGGAQPNISQTIIKDYSAPLPPLSEQQRIVVRIESLFRKLDEAKEIIEKSLKSFSERKQKILHDAFSGKLMGSTEMWKKTAIGDCVKFETKSMQPTDFNTLEYIGLENIASNGRIIEYSSSENIRSVKTIFHFGDILLGKLRPYLNKHDIADRNGVCSTDILVLRCNDNCHNKYLNYYLDLNNFILYCTANSRGINLPRTSKDVIGKYEIVLPSIPEQKEIVRILDSLFEKEDKSKELVDCLDEIKAIKKTILAKAFRGQLGTNDPTEESAKELLKQIVEEKYNAN